MSGHDDDANDEEEFDLEACEAEGTEVARHSVETDGMAGSCSHSAWYWQGRYWGWSMDFDACGPFDTLLEMMEESEFFVLNEGVWHELSSTTVAHDELVSLVAKVQPAGLLPEEPMELAINAQRYVLTPKGTLKPLAG